MSGLVYTQRTHTLLLRTLWVYPSSVIPVLCAYLLCFSSVCSPSSSSIASVPLPLTCKHQVCVWAPPFIHPIHDLLVWQDKDKGVHHPHPFIKYPLLSLLTRFFKAFSLLPINILLTTISVYRVYFRNRRPDLQTEIFWHHERSRSVSGDRGFPSTDTHHPLLRPLLQPPLLYHRWSPVPWPDQRPSLALRRNATDCSCNVLWPWRCNRSYTPPTELK